MDYKVTHTLTNEKGELVAEVEEWQGTAGPYQAFRYRKGDWEAAYSGRLEWAIRAMLSRRVEYLHSARRKADRDVHARAIREMGWAMASWATGENWVALDT
jgi:hypothetical protein